MAAGFVLLCALFFWLAPFGLELSDEGYILYPAYQVSEGLLPYRDIVSLYTPMTWYLHGALFKLFGLDLLPIRYLFSVVKVGFILLTYLLARRLMPPGFAVLPGLVLVLLDPAPRHWAPYPAFYGLLGALAALLATSRFLLTRRGGWLLAAGLACAFVFSAKSSIGLFTLLALSAFLVYNHRGIADLRFEIGDCRSPYVQSAISNLKSAIPWAVLVGSVLAFALVVRRHLGVGTTLVFLLPVLAAGLLHLRELRRGAPPGTLLSLAQHLALLWGGFLVATLPWLGVLSVVVGLPLTFQWIFLSGVQTADAFYVPLGLPDRDTVEALGWVLGGGLAAAAVSVVLGRHLLGRASGAAVAAAGALALGGALAASWYRAGVLGMSLSQYLLMNIEGRVARHTTERTDLVMYVPVLGFWLGCAWLLWMEAQGKPVDARRLHVRLLVLFGSMFLFQLYPKASNYHVLFTVAPYLVLVAFLLSEVFQWCVRQWRTGGPSRITRLGLALGVLVFPLVFVAPSIRIKVAAVRASVVEPRTSLAGLRLSPEVAVPLDGITEYLHQRTAPGEPIFVYPASPMFYLAAQRPNPTRFSYLPSGYIDPPQQQEIIAVLDERRVRYAIWDQQLVDRWGLLPMDRPLVDYLWTSYRPVWSVGSYLVLERVGQ